VITYSPIFSLCRNNFKVRTPCCLGNFSDSLVERANLPSVSLRSLCITAHNLPQQVEWMNVDDEFGRMLKGAGVTYVKTLLQNLSANTEVSFRNLVSQPRLHKTSRHANYCTLTLGEGCGRKLFCSFLYSFCYFIYVQIHS
jgi:hypothetical protein